jgi:hypothetical protein
MFMSQSFHNNHIQTGSPVRQPRKIVAELRIGQNQTSHSGMTRPSKNMDCHEMTITKRLEYGLYRLGYSRRPFPLLNVSGRADTA